jgi:hypothetical protein
MNPLIPLLIKQEITETPNQKPQTLQFFSLRSYLTHLLKPFPTKLLIALLIKQEITGK